MPILRTSMTVFGLACLLSACEPAGGPGPGGDSPPGMEPLAEPASPFDDEDFVERSTTLSAVSFDIGEKMQVEQTLKVMTGLVPPEELTYDNAQEALIAHNHRRVELLEGVDSSEWKSRLEMGEARIRRKGTYIEEDFRSTFEGQTFLVHYQNGRFDIEREDGNPLEEDEAGLVLRVVELSRVGYDLQPIVDKSLQPGQIIPFHPDRQNLLRAVLGTESPLEGHTTYRGVAERDGVELAVFDIDIEQVEGPSNLSTEMPVEGRAWIEVESGRLRELHVRGTKSAPAFSDGEDETLYFLYDSHSTWSYED